MAFSFLQPHQQMLAFCPCVLPFMISSQVDLQPAAMFLASMGMHVHARSKTAALPNPWSRLSVDSGTVVVPWSINPKFIGDAVQASAAFICDRKFLFFMINFEANPLHGVPPPPPPHHPSPSGLSCAKTLSWICT